MTNPGIGLTGIKPNPGTYVLVLRSDKNQAVEIGRWGLLNIHPGYYFYVGTAFRAGDARPDVKRKTAIQLSDITILVVMGLVAVFLIPVFSDARFTIENRSREAGAVRASWSEHNEDIGILAPAAGHEFRVDGEAAMRFTVVFPDGREIASRETYFSSGVTVNVVISDTAVTLRYAAGSP